MDSTFYVSEMLILTNEPSGILLAWVTEHVHTSTSNVRYVYLSSERNSVKINSSALKIDSHWVTGGNAKNRLLQWQECYSLMYYLGVVMFYIHELSECCFHIIINQYQSYF